MESKGHTVWTTVRETFSNWSDHGATTHAAALAYYFMFSLAPVLILVIAATGWAFGDDAVRGRLYTELDRYIGAEGAELVQKLVAASAQPRTGSIAALIGLGTLIVTATGALMQLQETLNTVWEVKPKPGFFLKTLLLKRLLCFGLIFAVGGLLLTSIAASAALAAVQRFLEARLELGLSKVLGGADVLLSWLLVTALIAIVYRVLPDVELGWREVAWGSAFTAVLLVVGKYAIGFYLSKTGVTSTFGAAGSLALVLTWIYYSSLVFLLGAELTRVHSRRYRAGKAQASPGAERTKKVAVPIDAGSPTPETAR